MKVLYQHQGLINEEYKKFFRSQLPKEIELIFPADNKPETLLKLASEADIYIGFSINKEFLEKATKLKHIQIPWTGLNSMDKTILENYDKITISNSHSNSLAIAEHAVALLFSAAKLLTIRDSGMRKGDWSSRYGNVNSVWLTGKKLGIIGYGAIGKKVARMLKIGFNMKVLAIKRTKSNESDDICDYLGSMDDLDYVLKEADFILISTPLTSETENLIDAKEFSIMKETAVIVNIARGPIINEKSLFQNLKEKKIAAAGIDVWYNYPKNNDTSTTNYQNYPFEELDNIVMTPHSAFKVRDREEIFAQDIIANIKLIFEGKKPINQVNLELGY